MAYTQARLQELAGETAQYLTHGLNELQLANAIRDTYAKCCRESLAHVGVVPRELSPEDLQRLDFEMLSFATFLVFGLLKKRIVKRHGLLKRGPDDAGIRYFQGELLRHVEGIASDLGCQEITETVLLGLDVTQEPEFGPGAQVALADRVFEYLEASETEQGSELRLFGKHIGLALDPPHYPVLEVIGTTHWEMLLELAQISLRASFGR